MRSTSKRVVTGAALAACMPMAVNAANSTWLTNVDASWSTPGNWSADVPNATDAAAFFAGAISMPRTVTVDSPQTVGSINFNSALRYTLAGPGTITLSSSTNKAALTATMGSHTIAAPISLSSNTTFTSLKGTLTMSGGVAGIGKSVTAGGGGTLEFGQIRIGALSLGTGATRILPSTTTNASSIASLTPSFGTGFDLTNNDLQIATANYDDIRLLITDGNRGLGDPNSPAAIFSSTARVDPRHVLGFGELTGAQYRSTGRMTFDGLAVNDNDILVKYVVQGDTNFDGAVNALDFNVVASNFGKFAQWFNGDVNLDGFVNTLDFAILAKGFNQTAGDPVAAPVGAAQVPEPDWPGVAACIGVPSMGKRKRRLFMH